VPSSVAEKVVPIIEEVSHSSWMVVGVVVALFLSSCNMANIFLNTRRFVDCDATVAVHDHDIGIEQC
jgi:hypothetical protein